MFGVAAVSKVSVLKEKVRAHARVQEHQLVSTLDFYSKPPKQLQAKHLEPLVSDGAASFHVSERIWHS